MYSKFLCLDEEKRKRILNAALKEFAARGYDLASTNEIVKDAGISKGLLFHYFKNKKHLFLFLYDYAIETSVEEFYKRLNFEERDFFKRIQQVLEVKMEFLTKHPDLFQFLEEAYSDTSPEIREDVEKRNMKFLGTNAGKVFENIDTSRFKEGLDLQKAISIITWTSEGMANEAIKKSKFLHQRVDYAKMLTDYQAYAQLLKESFYKE